MSTLDAWSEYIIWSRRVIEMATAAARTTIPLSVLKTDANNEAFGNDYDDDLRFYVQPIFPHIENMCNVSCVDIDQNTAAKALEKFPDLDVRVGSITDLPFPNESFHVILDLSTIDHVMNYEQVLNEYSRVLKPGGYALIVSWLDSYTHEVEEQIWFEHDAFLSAINARFKIIETQFFDNVNGVPYFGHLAKIVCKKEP